MGGVWDCERYRVELSARLDGQDDPGRRQAVDHHLAGCAGCADWWQRADLATRLARTSAALPSPALSEQAMTAILAAAPAAPAPGKPSGEPKPTAHKIAAWLRAALLTVGLAQFLLGFAQISAYATTLADHRHDSGIASVTSGHLWHESAAWNVAIGAALAWLAWRRTRPAALLPVMTAFVAVLALLTSNDALAGRVDGTRILSHGLVLTGYALLLIMNLPRLRDTPPQARAQVPHGQQVTDAATGEDGPSAIIYPFPVRAAQASTPVTVRYRDAA